MFRAPGKHKVLTQRAAELLRHHDAALVVHTVFEFAPKAVFARKIFCSSACCVQPFTVLFREIWEPVTRFIHSVTTDRPIVYQADGRVKWLLADFFWSFSPSPALAHGNPLAVCSSRCHSAGGRNRALMQDPLGQLFPWNHPFSPIGGRRKRTEHELIEYRDRVEFAVNLIRRHEMRLWFEPNWRTALPIAEAVPQCVVFSIPDGARLVDELDLPPPWRRRG